MKISPISQANPGKIFQSDVSKLTQVLSQNPFLAGVLVTEMKDPSTGKIVPIKLSSVPRNIPHLLGRPSQGWLILNQNAGASVYEYQPANDSEVKLKEKEKQFFTKLAATADVTVQIWFF